GWGIGRGGGCPVQRWDWVANQVECARERPLQVLAAVRRMMMPHMKRRVLISSAIVGALVVVGAAPFLENRRAPLPDHLLADAVIVEKSLHRMDLFRDGKLLRTSRVAVGRGGR